MSYFVSKIIPSSNNQLTVAIKDNIDVVGHVSALGSAALSDAVPAKSNAVVVDSLISGGFHILAKTTMHELAFGMTGINLHSGTPKNYLFPGFIPGGSSSGSAAAVAAGEVDVALGTDTGGSVRLPAACCGVVGFKPSFGRISREGVQPRQSNLDCVGVLARQVELVEKCMTAMDSNFFIEQEAQEMVLGVIMVDADHEVSSAFTAAMNELVLEQGIKIKPLLLPRMKEAFEAGMTLIAAEAIEAFGHLDINKIGTDVAARITVAKEISEEKIIEAKAIQEKFTLEVSEILSAVDVFILPTLPSLPLTLVLAKNGNVDMQSSKFVRPFNVSGHPAISLPLKNSSNGPMAIQLVGKMDQDEKLCAIAKRVERSLASINKKQSCNKRNSYDM